MFRIGEIALLHNLECPYDVYNNSEVFIAGELKLRSVFDCRLRKPIQIEVYEIDGGGDCPFNFAEQKNLRKKPGDNFIEAPNVCEKIST